MSIGPLLSYNILANQRRRDQIVYEQRRRRDQERLNTKNSEMNCNITTKHIYTESYVADKSELYDTALHKYIRLKEDLK